jgi:predicted flap endonuclease-1-like 5' DNA nuclease
VAGGREPAPASCVEADHTNEAPVEAAEQQAQSPQPGSAPAPQAAAERAYDPPLAEIGFGPGMLIRLSQLGLHTTGDLAQADAGELRAALGDISRLVDVETWISNARQTARAG